MIDSSLNNFQVSCRFEHSNRFSVVFTFSPSALTRCSIRMATSLAKKVGFFPDLNLGPLDGDLKPGPAR